MEEALDHTRENGYSLWRIKAAYRIKDILAFLSPLRIIAPVKVQANGASEKTRLNWSLMLVACTFGFTTLLILSTTSIVC